MTRIAAGRRPLTRLDKHQIADVELNPLHVLPPDILSMLVSVISSSLTLSKINSQNISALRAPPDFMTELQHSTVSVLSCMNDRWAFSLFRHCTLSRGGTTAGLTSPSPSHQVRRSPPRARGIAARLGVRPSQSLNLV